MGLGLLALQRGSIRTFLVLPPGQTNTSDECVMKFVFILFSLLLAPSSLLAQGWYWQNPIPFYGVSFADANTGWVVGESGAIHHTLGV